LSKVYLAGPMRNIPYFNLPAFKDGAAQLRAKGYEVFSPAEKDIEMYGEEVFMANPTGDLAATAKYGFSIRKAMEIDCVWICQNADIVALLPGWENSKGARTEKALAETIGAEVIYL